MEKDQVIKMRDKLKAGKNWPLLIYIDNTFRIIDESAVLQFTKWDDENEILYNYSLTDANMSRASAIEGDISLFATSYDCIQSMEVAKINLRDLGLSLDSIGNITEEWKERIIKRFKLPLDRNLVNLTNEEINKVMGVIDGSKAINDTDDYYNGRYAQSFAETRLKASHNAYAEKMANKN